MSTADPDDPQPTFGTVSTSTKLFVYLVAVFVSCLLLGDIIGGKTIRTPLGPISVGILPFPVTFLLTDVVNDFYGRKGARFLTMVGFFMALLAWLVLQLSTWLTPDPSTWFSQQEFAKVFGGSAQLFVASMIAYLLGQFLDIHVFQFWKALTQSRHLWLRATGSTLLSQIIDTAVINTIFWMGKQPVAWILAKVGREYGIKVVVALLLTPAVYAAHSLVVRGLGIQPEKHELRRKSAPHPE